MNNVPYFIDGGIHEDERGIISFVNDFNFSDVKRFYTIMNNSRGYVRAWQGHKIEKKYFYTIIGKFLVCAVKIDNWVEPSKYLKPMTFILDENNPRILCIPPGFANGIKSLNDNSKLIIYSNLTLEKSASDLHRFKSELWYDW